MKTEDSKELQDLMRALARFIVHEQYGTEGRNEPLIDTSQAAKIMGIPQKSLKEMRCRGNGPVFIKVSSQSVRYRPSDVRGFIEAKARRVTPGAANS